MEFIEIPSWNIGLAETDAGRADDLIYDAPERTDTGRARFCGHCQKHMPDGPDVCLGLIPGVSHACCGHGDPKYAYVVIGGRPNEPGCSHNRICIYGERAVRFFELIKEHST